MMKSRVCPPFSDRAVCFSAARQFRSPRPAPPCRLAGGVFVRDALRLRRRLLPALLVVPLLVALISKADAQTETLSPSVSTASAPSITVDWDQEHEQPLGPSYDCENAQGSLEHTVCSDPLLSRLDFQVATLFHDRLKAAPVRGADSTAKIPSSALLWGYRDELEEEQRQWLQARDDKCDLSFDFDSGAGAHYTAIPCLIEFYAKRLVELDSDTSFGEGSGQRLLDVLVDVGSIVLGDTRLDLGNVRIDLPRVRPVTSVGASVSVSTKPHPACIDALLRARIPSLLRRDVCRAGTDHLPHAFDSSWDRGDYVTYVPWHPNRWGQRGDRFGYRAVGELRDGGMLLHVIAEGTGAGPPRLFSALAVTHGFLQGDTIVLERRIDDDDLSGFCGGGVDEVKIADAEILRLTCDQRAPSLQTK